jgi:hypothetical protein
MWSDYDKAESRNAESRNGVKRRALKLLLFLLAGAIINVAVAWGCALLFDPTDEFGSVERRRLNDLSFSTTLSQRRFGHTRINRVVGSSSIDPETGLLSETGEELRSTAPLSEFPDEIQRGEDLCGWPMHSLQCFYEGVVTMQTRSSYLWMRTRADLEGIEDNALIGGIRLPPRVNSEADHIWRAIPLMPIWPGFAINTIFYAAVLWVLFAVPVAMRKRVRRKRGQCAACGYSLQGSESNLCPECGALVNCG